VTTILLNMISISSGWPYAPMEGNRCCAFSKRDMFGRVSLGEGALGVRTQRSFYRELKPTNDHVRIGSLHTLYLFDSHE
jgi:hypothetical protein